MNTKSILMSILMIGVVAMAAGAGTMAYFNDTETSTGNTFTAGTLNLIVGANDPCNEVITVGIADTYGGNDGVFEWDLQNDGSLAGSLDITFSNLVDLENGVNEPEEADDDEDGTVADPGVNGELADNLDLLIYIDQLEDDNYVAAQDQLVYDGMAVNIVGEKLSNYAMAAAYDKSIRIEWSIAATVDNEIQSDSAGFDIGFELLQVAD